MFSSHLLATLVQLCVSNDASPAWGQREWSGEVGLTFWGQLTTAITALFPTHPMLLPLLTAQMADWPGGGGMGHTHTII